ncbi:MAG: hypothetical protein IJE89_00975 [Bacilli bacterium]|nr:hypothetical protein [Bacilli bacterium]
MKKMIKGVFIPLVVSMICGFVCAKLVYRVYGDDIENTLESSKIYLIQNGEYLTYDNMREENALNNYIYYKDEDGYKSVIGITKKEDNIDKIKSLYNDNLKVEEYYVSTELLNDKQNEYDIILSNTDDLYEVKEVVDNILNLYREDDTIKFVLVE